ncbi:hypothetical protein KC19_VG207900 [Ceratodon purpureus]|uniref:Uncharacterized protein n=1 Tax=Ceratodon purpureus TaxID=3225 RepID=A0A8T0HSQ0_CERPU|nr:hypothetical protein KC19_VG207900 [Ceratodon purpureus]
MPEKGGGRGNFGRGFLDFGALFATMNSSFDGMVVLVWMLMSMTLGNCATYKSRASEVLDSMNGFYFVPLLWLIATRKNRVPRIFWVEPSQATHWDYVEPIVWRATKQMHYRKYI